MNENASSAIDAGYDAICMDNLPNDMYFVNEGVKLVINGEGYFDEHASYPLSIKTNSEGPVSIVLDGTENFNPDQSIYIYDAADATYHDLRYDTLAVTLAAGETNDRFSLRFNKGGALAVGSVDSVALVGVSYSAATNAIRINNATAATQIEEVTLYSIVGQAVANWKVNSNQATIELAVPQLSAGTYIVRTKTSEGVSSKKILIP
jgi:hypothetical protein